MPEGSFLTTHTLSERQSGTVAKADADRILVIGPSPPPYNGMSVATDLVLQCLSGDGHHLHLDTADHRSLSNVGKIDFLNIFLALNQAAKYLYQLITQNPNIVYVPIAQDKLAFLRDSLFLIPARAMGKKVVVHLHGGYFDKFYQNSSPYMRYLVRYSIGKAARGVVLGESLICMLSDVLPLEKIRVIPNGIPDHYACESKSSERRNYVILFLSTLMKEKGVFTVLDALPRIAERVPGVEMIFAGEWLRADEEARAHRIVRDLKLDTHVRFLGPVAPPMKFEVIRNADIFVMPTYYKNEGHPYVLLEAMSAGLPIVTSKAGCIPETVIDGSNGFIIDAKNVDEFANKVISILTDEKLRRRMGDASRRRFLERYTIERFSNDIQQLFGELSRDEFC